MKKVRLDQMVAHRGLAESREKAQRLIRTGRVRVDGQPATKPGHIFREDVEITVESTDRFVSQCRLSGIHRKSANGG